MTVTHTHTHTHTHTCLPLLLRAYKHTRTHFGRFFYSASTTHTHANTSSCVMEICLIMTHIHTPIPILTLDCLHKHICLHHVYRSVFPARNRRYTQSALHATGALISPVCDESLSRDGRTADCTARHPGVERPFSSFYLYDYISKE